MRHVMLPSLLLLAACASQPGGGIKTVTIEGKPTEVTEVAGTGDKSKPVSQKADLSTRRNSLAELREAVEASRARFRARHEIDPSYSFTSSSGSFSGTTSKYALTADGDTITERRFELRDPDGSVVRQWTETGADVGSHDGGPKQGIDALHGQCLDKILTQPTDDNDMFVSIGDDGLLRACVYVPKGCMDDCSHGVEGLSAIGWD